MTVAFVNNFCVCMSTRTYAHTGVYVRTYMMLSLCMFLHNNVVLFRSLVIADIRGDVCT